MITSNRVKNISAGVKLCYELLFRSTDIKIEQT